MVLTFFSLSLFHNVFLKMSHHKADVVMKETTKNAPKLAEVNDGIKSMSIVATDAVCQ
jgi:hypothetical protein